MGRFEVRIFVIALPVQNFAIYFIYENQKIYIYDCFYRKHVHKAFLLYIRLFSRICCSITIHVAKVEVVFYSINVSTLVCNSRIAHKKIGICEAHDWGHTWKNTEDTAAVVYTVKKRLPSAG
jgi:hypothetical protein